MTCEQMIYKFADFDPETHFVVSPEGLNRQYAKGMGGDAVANWMTKRDRLHEISDFSEYLTALYRKYQDLLPQKCSKTVLAFSQGGTTMFRWLHAQKIQADFLIPYSCWIPEDIDLRKSESNLDEIKIYYTYGLSDPFINEKRIKMVESIILKNELELEILPYDGDHRVSKRQVMNIWKKSISS